MNIKASLDLIKDSLLEEKQCIACSIQDCAGLLETLEEELASVMRKIKAIEEIEKFSSLKLIK
ncbi:MAG TPA: hypothetical protein GXX67_12540 [Petrimonas sp.]|nr:hypothetical protein [Petrimonas sp.]